MRIINFTIKIEDNDLIELKTREYINALDVVSIKTLPQTEHVKENKAYKDLLKQKKSAQVNIDKFLDKHRE